MNTGKLFRTVAASVAAALSLTMTAACSGDTAPGAQSTTDTSASAPATSPKPTPAPKSVVTKTVDRRITVTPPAPPKPTASKPKPTSTPIVKPAMPKGPFTPVEASQPGDGNYGFVVKDTTKPRDPITDEYPLACRWPDSLPIVLTLNGTTPTGGKNRISTIVTNDGVVVFGQKGSVLPSTTLIANKKLYTNLASTTLAKPLFLSSGLAEKSWGEIGELIACQAQPKRR